MLRQFILFTSFSCAVCAATPLQDYPVIQGALGERTYTEWSYYDQTPDAINQYYGDLMKKADSKLSIIKINNQIVIVNRDNKHRIIINFYVTGQY